MGLFDKKYCDICGDKIGLLGNRKLEDGNLCKNCAKKLSPWFDERRHSTVDQIKKQLVYREENRSQAAAFNITRSFGKGSHKLYVDDNARKFAVNRGTNFSDDNPDILDFSQAVGCDLNIDEHRRELKRTVDGKSVSYNPPRYEYSYDFTVTIRVSHPYFDDMKFNLKGSSVDTGERCMTGMNTGGWSINSTASSFLNQRGINEYNELVRLGNELKATVDSWRNGAQPFGGMQQPMMGGMMGGNVAGAAQIGTVRFGSPSPVPYLQNIGGSMMSLEVQYSGSASVSALNPTVLQSYGGLNALENVLSTELVTAVNMAVSQCSSQGIGFAQLPAKATEISGAVKANLENKWAATYGVALQAVSVNGFSLTQDSQAKFSEIQRMQMGQMQYQQTQPTQQFQQYQQPQYQQQQYQQQQYQQQQYQQPVQTMNGSWICPNCGAQNTGRFCTGCGSSKA